MAERVCLNCVMNRHVEQILFAIPVLRCQKVIVSRAMEHGPKSISPNLKNYDGI